MGVLIGLGGSMGAGGFLSAIGTIVSAIGQMQQMAAQSALAEAQANIARQNAALASEAGREEAQYQDQRNRALIGQQVANMAGSGVKVGSKSFLRARESLYKVAGQEASNIVRAYDRKAWSYRAQAKVYDMQANAYASAATGALFGGLIGAATSIVGSARPYSVGPTSPRLWHAPTYGVR